MRVRVLAASLILLAAAAPAKAELVFFSSGQAMSVKGHRTDGHTLTLSLRDGGEITCDSSVVRRITDDEAPYPEEHAARDSGSASGRPPLTTDAQGPSFTLNSVPYGAVIDRIAAEQGVPAKLVRAVIAVESAGQPQARSNKGAVGLMQLMPQTARLYTAKNPYDPTANIEAGIKHLRMLLDRFPLALALAAYNAGEAAVQRFGGIPPYPETQRYVTRVLQLVGR